MTTAGNNFDLTMWPGYNKLKELNGPQLSFMEKIVPATIALAGKRVLTSINLAQAILESGWGTSELAKNANNLFGIKADKRWTGQGYTVVTSEWSKEKGHYTMSALFRAYHSLADSINDHVDFLMAPRYRSILGDKNYESVANKLRAAGYATDPKYPTKLINVIKFYNLMWFDDKRLAPVAQAPKSTALQVGDMVNIKPNSKWLTNPPKQVPAWAYTKPHRVDYINGEKVILNKDGINSPININNLVKV